MAVGCGCGCGLWGVGCGSDAEMSALEARLGEFVVALKDSPQALLARSFSQLDSEMKHEQDVALRRKQQHQVRAVVSVCSGVCVCVVLFAHVLCVLL